MQHFTIINVALLLLVFTSSISAQSECPSACFQGTPENAGPPVDDSFCPPAAGIVNPFYTPSCLCYTPETFDGSPWLFCYTCGGVSTGDFADICGTTQVTQSCPNQQDSINDACSANDDVNDVLGKLCDDGKPSSIVTGIGAVVEFLQPELADGALALIAEGCTETKAGQAISGAVSDVCSVWKTAGCGTVDAASTTGSTESSTGSATSLLFNLQNLTYAILVALVSTWVLLGY